MLYKQYYINRSCLSYLTNSTTKKGRICNMRRTLAFFVVCFLFICSTFAEAYQFSWNFTSRYNEILVGGELEANPTGDPNEYLITNLSGSYSGLAGYNIYLENAPITGFVKGGPTPFTYPTESPEVSVNNLFYFDRETGASNLSATGSSGFVFFVKNGEKVYWFNPWFNPFDGKTYLLKDNYDLGGWGIEGDFSVSLQDPGSPIKGVPEPFAPLLLGIGIIGIAAFRKSATVQSLPPANC